MMKYMLCGLCLLLLFTSDQTLALETGHAALVDTGLVVQPTQFSFSGLAGSVFSETLLLKNFTSSAMQVNLAESVLTASELSSPSGRSGGNLDIHSLLRRLRPAFQRAGITAANFPKPVVGPDNPQVYNTIITDERGENVLGSADVYRVQYQSRTFLGTAYHDFRIILAIPPDSNIAGFISIDTDQDFGTGAFPTPFGVGPTARDIGSEREVFFDASGVIIDSLIGLGRIPAGVVLSTETDTIVGTPFLLSITKDSVLTVTTTNILQQGIRADWLSDPDGKMNVGVVAARYTQGGSPAPDYAPGIGHGVVGGETGVSWLSETPMSLSIPAGDSATVTVTGLAARTAGTYNARLAATSLGRNPVHVPVTLNVTGVGQPHIVLGAPGFTTSVPLGDSTFFDLTISNTGNADLVWGILDTNNTTWVTSSPNFGSIAPSSSGLATLTLRTAGLTPNTTYTSQLLVVSNDPVNNGIAFPLSMTVLPSLGVVEETTTVPSTFALLQNYPNPFNPKTTIGFHLPAGKAGIANPEFVTLKVFDLLGREAATLVSEEMKPGNYTVGFDATGLGSGVYFYKLTAGRFTETKKLILMK